MPDTMAQMLVARLQARQDTTVDAEQIAEAIRLLHAIANGERSPTMVQ